MQAGALVCLIVRQRFVVFCTVAQPTMPTKDNEASQRKQESRSLWKDTMTASVVLTLVDPTPQSTRFILDQYSSRKAALSLVNFLESYFLHLSQHSKHFSP